MTHITISRTHTNLPFNILIDIIRIKTFFHRSLKEEEEEEVRATRLGKQQPSAVASGGDTFSVMVCVQGGRKGPKTQRAALLLDTRKK